MYNPQINNQQTRSEECVDDTARGKHKDNVAERLFGKDIYKFCLVEMACCCCWPIGLASRILSSTVSNDRINEQHLMIISTALHVLLQLSPLHYNSTIIIILDFEKKCPSFPLQSVFNENSIKKKRIINCDLVKLRLETHSPLHYNINFILVRILICCDISLHILYSLNMICILENM